MRYLVIARPAFGENSKPSLAAIHIAEELNSIGHETKIVTMVEFYINCSYAERKLYKMGMKSLETKYNQKLLEEVINICDTFKPDCILILTGLGISEEIREYISRYKIILWLWDSVKRFKELELFVPMVNEVFCFEYDDVEYLSNKYHISARYVPLGADSKVYYPKDVERDIDISFIGSPYKNRIQLLERVCEQANIKSWTVQIGGLWYDTKHFWKKYQFMRKYPNLGKCIDNRYFNEIEAADLYRRSKICLNINTVKHKSLNPRTFEICATKSFQIMNAGQDSHHYLDLQRDLVIYDNEEDLLGKIEYYLKNADEREQIAKSGYEAVMKKCTLQSLVRECFIIN